MADGIPPFQAAPAGSSVGRLFQQRARMDPGAVALREGARSLSFGELDARVNRLADVLTGLGITAGERIALLSRNRMEYVEVELAAGKIGAITACQNWRLADPELRHCLDLVEPLVVIVEPDYEATLDRVGAARPRILLGDDYEARLAAASDDDPDVDVDPEQGFVILYTSGTTGMPKGALISHRAMIARSMVNAAELMLPPDEAILCWPPFFHMASTDQGIGALLRGSPVIIVDGYDPGALIDVLERHRIGWLPLIPGMVEDFVRALRQAQPRIKGVRICGAMPDLVPPHQIAAVTRLLGAPYLNTFGATETGLPPATGDLIAVGEVPTDLAKRQTSYCELKLVDAEDNEVPVGVPGEVCMRGPTLFSGYWRAPETNAKDFRGGWFHMGDVLARREDGRLTFMDRVKYMIKSGGENIYPAEIERVLLAHPRVEDACVVRRADARWGEVPVAAVATAQDTAPDAAQDAAQDRAQDALRDDLLAACRAGLAGYKQPKEIRFVAYADLPRSTTGKIQRHEVEKWFAEAPATRAGYSG